MAPTGRPRGRGRGRGRAARAGVAVGRGGSAAVSAGNDDQAADAAVQNSEAAVAQPTSTLDSGGSSGTVDEAPAASGAPASAAVAPAPRPRGTASTRARGASVAVSSSAASSGSKFKPRAVRRGDAERERLAQEELRKQNIKLAEDQRLQRARGRGRRARGRGDAMGRGGFDRRYNASNSIFGNPGASSSGFKTDSGFKSSGYRDQSNRLNADMFSGSMLDGDYDDEDTTEGASSTKQTPRKREVMPMGITRREPQKKELVVATTADMVAKEKAAAGIVEEVDQSPAKTPDEDVEMQDDGKVWPGASDTRRVKVKDEHGKFVEVTEIDDKRLQRAAESDKRRMKEEEEEKKKPKVRVYQSREEETRVRQYSMLSKEFGPRQEGDSKDGRLYLFQFPPTLPPLRVVHRPKPKSIVKHEPVDDDLVTIDVGTTVDLTEGDKKVDVEEEEEEEEEDDPLNPYPDIVGYVGKMIVRKSGRVEMDWGGFPFQVMPGITTNFITNAVLLEDADSKIKQGEIAGKAYGMGQIMGRFNVRPVYTKPEPGVIDPWRLEQLRQKAREAEAEKARVLTEKRLALEPLLQSLQKQKR